MFTEDTNRHQIEVNLAKQALIRLFVDMYVAIGAGDGLQGFIGVDIVFE